MTRAIVLAVLFSGAISTNLVAQEAKTGRPVVDFDTAVSFACRDVTSKDFRATNPELRIIEAPLRISAGFLTSEKNIEAIIYEIHIPEPLKLKDYLPQTKLASEIEELVKKQSSTAQLGLKVTSEGNAKIGYTLPSVFNAEAGVSGGSSRDTSSQVSSGVEAKILPPKQAIIAAFTKDRRQTLCFKLKPFSLTTLEDEKEFAMVLVVPKEWEGSLITLNCEAWQTDYKSVVSHETMTIALYPDGGDPATRDKYEKLAKYQKTSSQPSPPPSFPPTADAPSIPSSRVPASESGLERPSTKLCWGSYKYESSLSVYWLNLGADGKWDGRIEPSTARSLVGYVGTLFLVPRTDETFYVRGDWSIGEDGSLVINGTESSLYPSEGWSKYGPHIFGNYDFDEHIKKFDKDLKIIRMQSGKEFRPE